VLSAAIARPGRVIDRIAVQHPEGFVYIEMFGSLEPGFSVMLAVARVHKTINSGRARNQIHNRRSRSVPDFY